MLPYDDLTPTYDLRQVQWLVGQGELSRVISKAAKRGGTEMAMEINGIVEVVLALEPADFYKTMESEQLPGLWQDVYHRRVGDVEAYIKIQIDRLGRGVVIQFKRR